MGLREVVTGKEGFSDRFQRHYKLAKNQLIAVSLMYVLDWRIGGDSCKWHRRLFALEEEWSEILYNIFSRVGMDDR